jgi:hypothetical protein
MIRRALLILTTRFFYGAVVIFRPLLRWKAGVSSGYSCIGKDYLLHFISIKLQYLVLYLPIKY